MTVVRSRLRRGPRLVLNLKIIAPLFLLIASPSFPLEFRFGGLKLRFICRLYKLFRILIGSHKLIVRCTHSKRTHLYSFKKRFVPIRFRMNMYAYNFSAKKCPHSISNRDFLSLINDQN